ncbi:hypothetical protein EJB05_02870, partial [Eragrostis curvula]
MRRWRVRRRGEREVARGVSQEDTRCPLRERRETMLSRRRRRGYIGGYQPTDASDYQQGRSGGMARCGDVR